MAYTLIPEVRRALHILLRKVYVVGMCQVGAVVFLLLPMLEPLILRLRAHSCLTYIECSNLTFKGHGKIVHSLNSLNIFHQNIRGLMNKSDELINSFVLNIINPHILC
jgi:hypothetical protein